MTRYFPPRHGRTHLPGGSDPIPGSDVVDDQTPPFQEANVLLSEIFGFSDGWNAVTIDTTVFADGYRGMLTPAVDKWVAFPFMLGPKGSVWGVTTVHQVGPNFGKAIVEVATSSQDGLPGATGFEGPGLMEQPTDVTFHRPIPAAIDAYAGAPASNTIVQRTALFRIGGDPGDVLTTFGVDGVTGKPLGDGGPGLYWVRLYITGKHASSSDYQFNLQYLAVERIPGG